jgi:Na+/proline symporter
VILAGFAGVALAGVVQAGGWDALRAAVDVRLAEAGRDAAAWWSPTGADWVPIIGMLFAAAIHTPAASVYVNFASAARSSRVLVPGFLLAAVLAGIMPMLAGLIGVQTVARFGLASGLTGYRNITAVAVDISPWLGGLAIAAVLAAVISSGGPVLLSSATMWVRDCMPGSRDWTSDRRLRAYRLTTLVFGVAGAMLAWVAAVRGVSLLTLLLAGFAMVVPPGIALTFLLYWRRTTERAAFWGMATGFGAGLAWFAGPYQATGIDPSYPTTIVPLVVMPLLSLAGRGEDDRAAAFFARLRGDDS